MKGTCWQCGSPDHYQYDCPKGVGKGGKGGKQGLVSLPAALSSWRPPAWPGPSASQWRAWTPKPFKGKGKGKSGKGGKGKGETGDIDMGDAAYVGNGYNYFNYAISDGYGDYYYPQQLGRDIGMLSILQPSKTIETFTGAP